MGQRLEELCKEVTRELRENRERRRQWFVFTWDWKSKWMPFSPYADRTNISQPRIIEKRFFQ